MYISVIICTHNPNSTYLKRTLNGLRGQTLSVAKWDLILVDNCSESAVEERFELGWHPAARVVVENELGLTSARLRGIRESRGDLLVFVDDDNVLGERYLEDSVAIAKRLPQLGCFGAGQLVPEFEEEPEVELRPYTSMLALRSVDQARWSNVPEDDWLPWGAGMVVTKDVALAHARRLTESDGSRALDRKGDSLVSCGDDEFSWTACEMGYGRGVFPELKIAHLIDKRRVQREYLLRLAEGIAYSRVMLRSLRGLKNDRPGDPPSGRKVISAMLRLSPSLLLFEAQGWWKERRKPEVEKQFEQARRSGRLRALGSLER